MHKVFSIFLLFVCLSIVAGCKTYDISGRSKELIRSVDTIFQRETTHIKEREWTRGDTIFHVFETTEKYYYDNTHYRDTIIRDTVWMNLAENELEKAAYQKGKNSGFFMFLCLAIIAGLFFFGMRSKTDN